MVLQEIFIEEEYPIETNEWYVGLFYGFKDMEERYFPEFDQLASEFPSKKFYKINSFAISRVVPDLLDDWKNVPIMVVVENNKVIEKFDSISSLREYLNSN